MDNRTLIALKGSIAKWEAIVAGTGEDHGSVNCPLCTEFIDKDCKDCPIKQATKAIWCGKTPYMAFAREAYMQRTSRATTPELVALAQAELDFLRSLLPTEEQPS